MSLDSDARSSYKMSVSNSEGIPIESVEFYFFYLLVSFDSVDTLADLLHDANPYAVKVVIQTLTTVFPLLFRQL